jgi:prepilin-type N-terminal cleavage/methylation domain-containing protein
MLNNTFDIKKNIEFYLQNYKTRQSFFHDNEGFTLIELLVSVAIMTIVVSIVGVGLGTMLKQNRKAESESDRRANLNRALDYITNEVRSANSIKTSASSGDNLTLPSGFNIPSNTYGLVLTFPDNTKSVVTREVPVIQQLVYGNVHLLFFVLRVVMLVVLPYQQVIV